MLELYKFNYIIWTIYDFALEKRNWNYRLNVCPRILKSLWERYWRKDLLIRREYPSIFDGEILTAKEKLSKTE